MPADEAVKCVNLLLKLGAKKDLKDNRGWTAMMIAANMGHIEVVKTLITSGADPFVISRSGKSASKLAEKAGHTNIVEVLNSGR